MSSMEDRMAEYEAMAQSQKTEAALASIHRSRMKSRASSYAMTAAISGYGNAVQGDGLFGRASRGAMWFCIWFAMIAPVLVFWHVML